jgi:hypothetical protein
MSFLLSDFGFTLSLFVDLLPESTQLEVRELFRRYGLIRVDAADQTLMDLRKPMQ